MLASWKLRVLGEPAYRRLFAGRTTSLIGDGIAPIALAFAVLGLTGSATDLGIVLAVHSVVLIALVLVGGVVADRISPRRAMLGADLTQTATMGLIAALLLTGEAEIWHLALLYGIDGAGTAFFNPASNALVPQIVPERRLQEAIALLSFSRWAGKVAGPALAGVLLALTSPGVALGVNALTFAISAACLWGVRAPRAGREREEPNFLRELRHGWREFSSRDWLIAIVVSAAISNAIFYPAFQVLGPTIANDSLGGATAWALIASLWGVGGLLGGVVALMIRPRRPLLVSEGFVLLLGLPLLLLAVPTSTAVIALGALVAGSTVSLAEILFDTVSAQHIPQQALSRVTAYDWFGSLALEPLGLALIGPVAAAAGNSNTLWVAAVAITLCQAVVFLVPGVRRLEATASFDPTPTPPPRPIEADQ
jgi:MFS family permease